MLSSSAEEKVVSGSERYSPKTPEDYKKKGRKKEKKTHTKQKEQKMIAFSSACQMEEKVMMFCHLLLFGSYFDVILMLSTKEP